MVAHVAPAVIVTEAGDYLQTFRIGGAPFEAADEIEINAWHTQFNALLRAVASPQVGLWSHLLRRPSSLDSIEPSLGGFASRLDAKYAERLAKASLHQSEWYLSVIYRPLPGASRLLGGALLWGDRHGEPDRLHSLDACEKLRSALQAGLQRYAPRLLTCVERHGRLFSEPLEFFGLLTNGFSEPVTLPRGPVPEHLGRARLLFGREAIEYRTATSTRLGAMLGIKEYPTPTVPGMLNELLSVPHSLVLTQSFCFLSKSVAQGLLQRQHHRMRNMGDFATSQADALTAALDELTSNEFAMGDHHLSLQVLTDPYAPSVDAKEGLQQLTDAVARVRGVITDASVVTAREDLALEAAFWAQLPGQLGLRPRKAPISTRNFAALSPWHTHPLGRRDGNHWGRATATFVTRARSPFHFSLHPADELQPAGKGRSDTGHTLICGPTGSGKTVLIGFLVAALSRQGVSQVLIDKDRGLDVLVRALSGVYLPLLNGLATGLNPLALEPSPENVEFLRLWLALLVRRESAEAPGALADLEQALQGTLALPLSQRRLSRLIEFLDPTTHDGPYARLAPWCASCGGERAWVFDNPVDAVAPLLRRSALMAFDVTDFLEHPVIRSPVTFYLFHLVRGQLDGRPFVCWMDEFSRLLADEAFRKFAQDGPNSWRKLNAVMALATQSARSILQSPISRTIVEQTPTKIFFPNAEAAPTDYIEGLGLSEQEYELVRYQLVPGGHQFLVKQGQASVVCELDLGGFDAELAVISGRPAAVRRVEALRSELGAEPEQWLPTFLREVESKSQR